MPKPAQLVFFFALCLFSLFPRSVRGAVECKSIIQQIIDSAAAKAQEYFRINYSRFQELAGDPETRELFINRLKIRAWLDRDGKPFVQHLEYVYELLSNGLVRYSDLADFTPEKVITVAEGRMGKKIPTWVRTYLVRELPEVEPSSLYEFDPRFIERKPTTRFLQQLLLEKKQKQLKPLAEAAFAHFKDLSFMRDFSAWYADTKDSRKHAIALAEFLERHVQVFRKYYASQETMSVVEVGLFLDQEFPPERLNNDYFLFARNFLIANIFQVKTFSHYAPGTFDRLLKASLTQDVRDLDQMMWNRNKTRPSPQVNPPKLSPASAPEPVKAGRAEERRARHAANNAFREEIAAQKAADFQRRVDRLAAEGKKVVKTKTEPTVSLPQITLEEAFLHNAVSPQALAEMHAAIEFVDANMKGEKVRNHLQSTLTALNSGESWIPFFQTRKIVKMKSEDVYELRTLGLSLRIMFQRYRGRIVFLGAADCQDKPSNYEALAAKAAERYGKFIEDQIRK